MNLFTRLMLMTTAIVVSAHAVDLRQTSKMLDEKLATYKNEIQKLNSWAEQNPTMEEATRHAVRSVYIPAIARVLDQRRALGLADSDN